MKRTTTTGVDSPFFGALGVGVGCVVAFATGVPGAGLGASAVVAVTTFPENEKGLVPMSCRGLGWAEDKYSELSTGGVAMGAVGAGGTGTIGAGVVGVMGIAFVVGGGVPPSTAGAGVAAGGAAAAALFAPAGSPRGLCPAGLPRGLCPAGVFITRS